MKLSPGLVSRARPRADARKAPSKNRRLFGQTG